MDKLNHLNLYFDNDMTIYIPNLKHFNQNNNTQFKIIIKTFMHYYPFQGYCKEQKPSCILIHFRVIARSKNLHAFWSISELLQGAKTFMHFDPFQGYCKERVSGWAGLTDQRRGHGRGLVGCSALVTPTGVQVNIQDKWFDLN